MLSSQIFLKFLKISYLHFHGPIKNENPNINSKLKCLIYYGMHGALN